MASAILQPPPPSTCPLGVSGALVIFKETENGAQLTFTTSKDEQVADLRERAGYASAVHGPGEHLGKGHEGKHGHGGHHGLKAMQLPPSQVGAENVEGGARISFQPVDKADLETLRTKLRERAREMMTSCAAQHGESHE